VISAQQRAHLAVKDARASGTLTQQPCEKCRAARTIAHHDDYDKPLEVRWLCRSHHGYATHKNHRDTSGKTQANWIILQELKDWVDREARKRGRRPAHVVEDIIRAVKDA